MTAKRTGSRPLAACMLLACTAASQARAQDRAISNYLKNLNYNPDTLLRVVEPGSTEVPPGKTRTSRGVILCSSTRKSLNRELENVTILSPNSGVVFPGALVSADRQLAEGKPTLISLDRAPLRISLDLPNLQEKAIRTVGTVSKSAVQAAIQEIEREWFKKPGNVQAARQMLEVKKAYSTEQIALSLGFSAKWGKADSLKLDTESKSASATSTCIALFRQVYYTASVDVPGDPAGFFASSVNLDAVRGAISAAKPAAYVQSVDYGRIILIRMDSKTSETEVDLSGAMRYATGGGAARIKLQADLEAKYNAIINNSTFTVVTLGGNAEAATQVMAGSQTAESSMYELIQKSSKFSRDNPAFPVSYTVNFLKDNQLATMKFSTDYTERTCTEYPSATVKLKHQGGYVARWSVTWTEKDASGKVDVKKDFNSGNVTLGWTKTLDFPGDAENIRIKADASVLFGWAEAMSVTLDHPNNKCYKIYGTVFERAWNNNCD